MYVCVRLSTIALEKKYNILFERRPHSSVLLAVRLYGRTTISELICAGLIIITIILFCVHIIHNAYLPVHWFCRLGRTQQRRFRTLRRCSVSTIEKFDTLDSFEPIELLVKRWHERGNVVFRCPVRYTQASVYFETLSFC